MSPDLAPRLSESAWRTFAAGYIPLGTVQAFEQVAIAREAQDLREFFEERAAILEHDAGLPRPEAEAEALRIATSYAKNRGHTWASLRASLAGYPVLAAQLRDRPSGVDALPLGLPTVAVLKDGRVVREGTFSGLQEVKA